MSKRVKRGGCELTGRAGSIVLKGQLLEEQSHLQLPDTVETLSSNEAEVSVELTVTISSQHKCEETPL